MNHWALEKNIKKNFKAQLYFDDNSGINLFLPAKICRQQKVFFASFFYHGKTFFPPSGKKYFLLAKIGCCWQIFILPCS